MGRVAEEYALCFAWCCEVLAVLGLRVSVVRFSGLGCYVGLYGVLCDPTSVRRC